MQNLNSDRIRPQSRIFFVLWAACLLMLLSACGQKGKLYLPAANSLALSVTQAAASPRPGNEQ